MLDEPLSCEKINKLFKLFWEKVIFNREASVLESARIEMKKMYLFPVKKDFGGNDVLWVFI